MKKSYKIWLGVISFLLFALGVILIAVGSFLGSIIAAVSLVGLSWFIYLQVSESKEPLKNKKAWIMSVIAFVLLVIINPVNALLVDSNDRGGDGVTTCKNCGRREVVVFGMCENCADGFLHWHNKNY